MAKPKFTLKNSDNKGESLIMLIYNFDCKRIKLSTKEKVYSKDWNPSAQQVRKSNKRHSIINDKINKLSSLVLEAHSELNKSGIKATPVLLKEKIEELKNPKKSATEMTFWDYFEEFIEYKKTKIKDVKDYNNSLRKHLEHTEQELMKTELTLDKLQENTPFMLRYEEWLEDEAINSEGEHGLMYNTIGKYNKNLRTFLNWMFNNKGFKRFGYDHLPVHQEQFKPIYLTRQEIARLESLNLKSKEEKIVLDLFLIGVYTALRFSDYSTLRNDFIKNDTLYITPIKTRKVGQDNSVVIPIDDKLKAVISKYNKLPNYKKGVTQFNKTLRLICKKAEIDEDITIFRTKKGESVLCKYKKYERISSHTARRTFCTLNYQESRKYEDFGLQSIMAISGHKTEKDFFRYVNIDNEIYAEDFRDFRNKIIQEEEDNKNKVLQRA